MGSSTPAEPLCHPPVPTGCLKRTCSAPASSADARAMRASRTSADCSERDGNLAQQIVGGESVLVKHLYPAPATTYRQRI
eukprot:6176500-Pleurochrysis_carterae.AAC.2